MNNSCILKIVEMKLIFTTVLLAFMVLGLSNCKKEYDTNGETIFRTGKNLSGTTLQDIKLSEMKMLHGCDNCHGSNGKGNSHHSTGSIAYNDLTNAKLHTIPYTDKLLERFIDHELKSDSTVAKTGVVWRMSAQDKADLIDFLKTL
jgi:hypothetical protein